MIVCLLDITGMGRKNAGSNEMGGAKALKAPPEAHVGGCLLLFLCIILLQIFKS